MKKTLGNGQKGPYLPEEWTGYCPHECDEIENVCIGGKSCQGFTHGTIDGQAECAICV
ncbi:hypothetical protein [Elizabethkingia meningoseptica]|uniref:hypothetical protein n=1 Tax=Elizabethkingia meningoseptica TaxID=238 RepID=UPI0023B1A08C|nr:hypothetical protein [Elizabethkingia meningoseptica]